MDHHIIRELTTAVAPAVARQIFFSFVLATVWFVAYIECVAHPSTLLSRPTGNLRYVPRLSAGQHDQPAINELVPAITDDLKVVDAWAGEGTVTFPDAAVEKLSALAPVRNGSGFRMDISHTVTDLQLLEDLIQRHTG